MPAEGPLWAPRNIDLDKPNTARIYDYYLGGACNFEQDREFAWRASSSWSPRPHSGRAHQLAEPVRACCTP